MFRKFMCNLILVQNIWILHFYRPSFRSSCPRGQASYPIVIGACATREQPFDLLLKPTQIIRGKSNWKIPFRDIWLSQRVSSCFPAPGKPWVSFLLYGVPSYRAHKKMVWSQEQQGQDCPLAITPGLSLLKASTPRPIQQLAFGGSMEFISPDFLGVIIVSHLQWNITLFLELLYILGSWRRWSYVLFFFLLKPGQVFVFAEVCRFSFLLMCSLLCADGQENSGLLPCLPPETDAKSSK